jgi:hypothetical protein
MRSAVGIPCLQAGEDVNACTMTEQCTDLRNSPRCRVTFDALAKGLQRHVTA